jgi:hypothetical protein
VGETTTAWYAAGGVLRGAWALTDWLALETEVGLQIPLVRTTLALSAPLRPVYEPPHVLLSVAAGLSVTARFDGAPMPRVPPGGSTIVGGR